MIKTRAAVLRSMGESPPYKVSQPLKIEELELMHPGPGEVLVEVAGAGLCHSDLSVIDGSRPRVMPMVMGHEASGIVCEAGQGVHEFREGDHVVFSYVPMCGHCNPCAIGRPVLCENGAQANVAGTLLSGQRLFRTASGEAMNHHLGVSAFSRYTVAAQESLVKIGNELPLEQAALFGCAVLTGVGAVVNTAAVSAGQSCVVFGLGGVGLSAIMGARAAGAQPVIGVDILPAKLDLALAAGATHVVNAGADDPVDTVRDITKGGADFAFESVGDERVLEQSYEATGRGGTTVAIGLPHPGKRFAVSAVGIVAEERTIKGSYMGSAVPRRDIPRYIAMYQAGQLPVDKLLTGTIGLADINAAFDELASGRAVRQVVEFTR